MAKVLVTDTLLDNLANTISEKSGVSTPMTIAEMNNAVDGIVVPSGSTSINQNGTHNVAQYETAIVSVSSGSPNLQTKTKTYTPTESQQTESVSADTGYDGLNTVNVTVNAISSTYVGSGIDRNDSTDLTANGATITAPAGYYSSSASKSVTSGVVTAPSSISGTSATVSTGTNTLTLSKTISVTPNVTTSGYITSGTAGNSSVSLTANVTTKGAATITPSTTQQTIAANTYLTGVQTISAMPSGTAGTPTATKGTVSNHSISVTPSVTNTTGYITGSTKTGTAVTVSASELVSGSQEITQNSTVDVTNLETVVVNVSGGGDTGIKLDSTTKTLASTSSSIQFTNLLGEPTSFAIVSSSDLSTGSSPYKTAAVVFDNTDVIGQYITNTSNAQMTYSDSAFSKSYSNGTLTVTGSGTNFQANEYKLVYTYGGSSANIDTKQVQVGSGATSITFTGLEDEPMYWSCIFTSDIGTSSGYTRAHVVVNDGADIYGMEMGSGSSATENWTATYSNGSLTISSQSTSAGGYFHQPGYYQLTYAYGGTIEIKTEPIEFTTNGVYTAPKGKAYTPVTVNVSGGGSSKNVQAYIGYASRTANSYGATDVTLTVAKSGTYKISWCAWRGSSSGTMGTNLHIGSSSGTNQQTWTGTYGQCITLTNQTLTANTVLTLYATSGSNSRTVYVGNLIIEEQ